MKFQKTAIATAVGATLAISGVASGVAYADGHKVEVYGRINNSIDINSLDYPSGGPSDVDSTNVTDIVSRIGVKASAPINGDLEAFGRYEFSVTSDSEGSGIEDTRIAEVGVRGDFGTVKIGNMWSTFYNMVGTHMDPTVTLGAVLYSTGTDLPYRVSNAIQYSNSFGAVSVSAELRLASDEGGQDSNAEKIGESDGTAIGASFNATENLLIAAVVDQQDENDAIGTVDEDRMGFAVKWSQDNWWASYSYGEIEYDVSGDATVGQNQFHVGASFPNQLSGFIGIGEHDIDVSGYSGDDPNAITMNLTKRFGTSGFRVYYEGIILSDSEDAGALGVYGFEQDRHIFGARIDF